MKKLVISSLTLLPGILLAWVVVHHLRLKSAFANIERGFSRAEIVKVLGEPHEVLGCGHFGGTPPADCVKQLSYLSILAFTDVWIVALDANDRVVGKLRYRSP
jgi:hypothetical protein